MHAELDIDALVTWAKHLAEGAAVGVQSCRPGANILRSARSLSKGEQYRLHLAWFPSSNWEVRHPSLEGWDGAGNGIWRTSRRPIMSALLYRITAVENEGLSYVLVVPQGRPVDSRLDYGAPRRRRIADQRDFGGEQTRILKEAGRTDSEVTLLMRATGPGQAVRASELAEIVALRAGRGGLELSERLLAAPEEPDYLTEALLDFKAVGVDWTEASSRRLRLQLKGACALMQRWRADDSLY